MEKITFANVLAFTAFVLPGFISMRVFSLLHPVAEVQLKDQLFEAVAFSIANVAVTFWLLLKLLEPSFVDQHTFYAWLIVVFSFFVVPIALPIVAFLLLRWLALKNWILQRHKTAWDDFFTRKQPCWVVIHLKDGRRIGGWFGRKSYASIYPQSGHLYLEALWELSDDAKFVREISRTKGIVLRPDDYHFLEFLEDEPANAQQQQQPET